MNIDKALESADGYYQTGNLGQAESLCREVLRVEPRNVDALLMLGVIYQQTGNYDAAITHLETALQLDHSNAVAHYNLGVSYQGKGQPDKAVSCYQRAIQLDPHLAPAYFNLGAVYQERDEPERAIALYRKALELDPKYVSAYYNLGSVSQERGRLEEAARYYQKALELDANLVDAWNALGIIFQEGGRPDEAIRCYRRAVEIDPSFSDGYYNQGKLLQQQGKIEEAVAYYREAIRLDPGSAAAYNNLGLCLQEAGRSEEALKYFRKAAGIAPKFAEAYYNLALYYQDKNLTVEAIEYYSMAIGQKPDYVDAHWNMACALLLSGNFVQGWREYEWRWKVKGHRGRAVPGPLWDGSDSAGRTVLLHAEQGFGDTLQFIRYAPMVARQGARVIVQCPEELLRLLSNVEGVAEVVPDTGPLPQFDLHCPLLSLPAVFGTSLENVPAEIPYIIADSRLSQTWSERLASQGPGFKVGLVWAGRAESKRERARSCSFELFSDLSRIGGVTLYSLQKGEGAEQAQSPPGNMKFIDLTAEIYDFADTAALIANLDLVISIDTAAAHLAGAMGKPVWTLLPFVPDWRWLLGRDDSPWYPTMRLFRQPAPGDWERVMGRVGRELRELVDKRK